MKKPLILITGGGRGIGAATAKRAAMLGYRVVINYHRNVAAAKQVERDIQLQGGEVFSVAADIADEAAVLAMFELIDADGGELKALVNNAGILEQQTTVESVGQARLQRIFATNVFGVFYCAREAIKRMSLKHGGSGGAIVNVSSGAAITGSPFEYVDYAASKGAVDTMTRGMALEVADQGIRINAVRPGIIDTEMHASGGEPGRVERLKSTVPLQRGGTVEEVASAILWLLSAESTFTTGSFLDVTGGR